MVQKNLLISGVGKGIGRQILFDSINDLDFVYAITRSRKDYLELKKKLINKSCKIYLGDIKNIKLIDKILKDSIKKKKLINCLVNNAGERQRKKFLKIKNTQIHNIFENNYFSHFFLTQKIVSFFLKYKLKNTSIINISSIVGMRGFNELSGYASTKSALDGLTKSLAIEFASKKIRFNSINPGFVKSSYYENFKKKNKKLYNWTLQQTPLKDWGENKDISQLVLFLISEKSKYITGQTICVDGGWTAQ